MSNLDGICSIVNISFPAYLLHWPCTLHSILRSMLKYLSWTNLPRLGAEIRGLHGMSSILELGFCLCSVVAACWSQHLYFAPYLSQHSLAEIS